MNMFIDTNGRFDTLIKMFAHFPEKSIRYKTNFYRFLILEGLVTRRIVKPSRRKNEANINNT